MRRLKLVGLVALRLTVSLIPFVGYLYGYERGYMEAENDADRRMRAATERAMRRP